MARPVNPNNTTVSVKLTPGEREAIEDYRWDPERRLEVSGVLRLAIVSFLKSEGIVVKEPTVADAPDAPADDKSAKPAK